MIIHRYLYKISTGDYEITDNFEINEITQQNKVYLTSDDPTFKPCLVELGKSTRTDCINTETVEVYAYDDTGASEAIIHYLEERIAFYETKKDYYTERLSSLRQPCMIER